MINAFSIDLEEWFCVSNFEGVFKREEWDGLESRLEAPTRILLDLMAKHEVKGTFFLLAWCAERHPDLMKEIADAGHEIASHGYHHQLVYDLTPQQFDQDLAKSLEVIKQTTGQDCSGYRAPSFSIRRDMTWAWETLVKHGFSYDSSIFPVIHDRYGEPDAPRFPFDVGAMKEFPMSTLPLWGKNIPVAGGGYFRLYPYSFTRRAIEKINQEGKPAIVYLHPWELDPGQPRPAVSKLKLARHRVGMAGVAKKIDQMFTDFEFGPVKEALEKFQGLEKSA